MSDFVAADPVFKVNDWKATWEFARQAADQSKHEDGTWVYQFYESTHGSDADSRLSVNEVYPDAASFLEHLGNVNEVLSKALEGPCRVESFIVSGPAEQLDKLQPALDPLGAAYFATLEGGVSRFAACGNKAAPAEEGKAAAVSSSFTIHPIFKVNDWARVRTEFIEPCIKVASGESGCLYYSFAKNENTGRLLCRERYASVQAALEHLQGVGPIMGACIESGILELEYACVYGSKQALETAKPAFEPFGTEFKEIAFGFDRLVLAPPEDAAAAAEEEE
jgi:quinol monooxygenase YgiN